MRPSSAIALFPVVLSFLVFFQTSSSGAVPAGTLAEQGTLQNCIQYALAHQPALQQSLLDEEITDHIIKSKLADWFPQLNFTYSIQHNYQLPYSFVQGSPPLRVGLINSSNGIISVSQTIFNKDVLLASTTAGDVREQYEHRTAGTKIDVVTNVSKAYYAALLTQRQIQVVIEDIVRLEQSLKDAYNQYQGGIVDKTDYKRATVSLNNARAQKKQYEELLKARYAYLKELMGYPADAKLELRFDTQQMENEIQFDTTQTVNYENRVEYRILQTQRRLDEAAVSYNVWSFLPSLSAFGAYNLSYQNDQLPQLYNHGYPSSYIGLQLTLPIFQGGKRIQEIKQAKLELERFDFSIATFKNSVNTEYTQALAGYKSNLNNYTVLKENLELAADVYHTIQLQYKAGTKTYLEVITAETDLRTAQANYTDALYQVLISKLDVEKALGTIQY